MKQRWAVSLGIGLLTVAVPLPIYGNRNFNDWQYFMSLSRWVRSLLIHYQSFSFHEPWKSGGYFALANPQNRIFSPLGLFDLLIPHPFYACALSWLFCAVLGSLGMILLLLRLGIPERLSWLGAYLFIAGSWFTLHFTEGHIPFNSFQLFPWAVLAWLNWDQRAWRLGLFSLLAAFLLDGGVYAFIFFLYFLVSSTVFGWVSLQDLKRRFRVDLPFSLACFATFALLAAPKWYPVVVELAKRTPSLDLNVMPLYSVMMAFFWPFHSRRFWTMLPVGFHEISMYLGAVSVAVIVRYFCKKSAWQAGNLKFLGFFLFWVWVGLGWLSELNPWPLVIHRIPLLNHAHVQSRTFILAFLAFVILLMKALTARSKEGALSRRLVVFLIIEALIVRWYPFADWPRAGGVEWPKESFVTSTNLVETQKTHAGIYQYFPEKKDMGSLQSYEPAMPFSPVVAYSEQPSYRGEIYQEPPSERARIIHYLPGDLEIEVWPTGQKTSTVVVNTNDYGYWKVSQSGVQVVSKRGDVLKLEVSENAGEKGPRTIQLRWVVPYLPWLFASYFAGIAVLIFLARLSRRGVRPRSA